MIYPLIAGLGVGGLFFAPILAMQAAMPIKDMATSTATVGLLRQLGSTVGVSVGQAIWYTVCMLRPCEIHNLMPSYIGTSPPANRKPRRSRHRDICSQSRRQYQTAEELAGATPMSLSHHQPIDIPESQPDSLRKAAEHAYTKSIALIWVVDTPFLGLSALMSQCLRYLNSICT